MFKLIFGAIVLASLSHNALAASAVITHAHSAYTVQVPGISGCARVFEGAVNIDNGAYAKMRCFNGDGYVIAVGTCTSTFSGNEAECTVSQVDEKFNQTPYHTFKWTKR